MTPPAFARMSGMTKIFLSARISSAIAVVGPLADAVRARVERDVAIAGLADQLGPVDVAVEDVQVRTEARS